MGVDPSIVEVLETAVAADPDNLALRGHLATVLADAGFLDRALVEAERVLAADPAHTDALAVAARAARASGDDVRADGFERLLSALSGTAGPAPAPAAPALPAVPAAAAPTGFDRPAPDPSGATAFDAELAALLEDASDDRVDVERSRVDLADVGGLEEVKAELERKFLAPMRNDELRSMYRKSLRGGLLLYGPPGCGKTFLARAIAGELDASFTSLGLHEVLDLWLGQSESNLHAVFERARRNAPCVLFLDELDALGHKRANLSRSAMRNVVVQLLAELDGIDGEANEGVFVLGATNQPWDIDPALRRPGRFDRTLLVVPPDRAARVKILELHLRDRPVDAVDLDAIAAATEGFSGADLEQVCETAAEFAIEASIRDGQTRPISAEDLARSVKRARPSTRPWFEMARNFVLFSNASGEFDPLADYMKRHRLL